MYFLKTAFTNLCLTISSVDVDFDWALINCDQMSTMIMESEASRAAEEFLANLPGSMLSTRAST